MAKTGLVYYNVDTNRYQDRRIKRLKKDFNCNGIAVYDYILCEIYRVEGCFLVWDENTAFDVSEYFGLKETTIKEIVVYCGAVGLFNKTLLTRGIITSLSIQKRYLEMCKRAKRTNIQIPEQIRIQEETLNDTEETPIIQEETPIPPEVIPQSKVKKSKEEKEIDKEKPSRFSSPSKTEVIDFFMGMENLKPSEAEEAANRFYSHHSKNKWSGVEDWHELAKNFKNYFKAEFGVINPDTSNQSSDENKPPETNKNNQMKRFTPPSTPEVFEYLAKERNLSLPDAEYWTSRFEDFYTANGWKVGKNPMKDWKAAVRTCVRNWDDKRQKSGYIHPAASHTGSNSDSILSKFNKK